MHLPLWLTSTNKGSAATLAICRNCGEVKVLSPACGFDHLSAILQFKDAATRWTA